MTCFRQNSSVWLLALNILVFSYACNNSTNSENSKQRSNASPNNPDSHVIEISDEAKLKVGGLYLNKNKEGTYSVSKILAMDNFTIHVRMYSDEFQTKPTQLNSTNLKVLIGHAPMDSKGFLAEKPELLTIEDVKESELDGYKIYLEEMRK